MKKNVGIRLLFVMFFLSGAAGLVYQVIWVRLFGLIFGNTIFASSTVLAAFMAGLAAGSFLFGRYIVCKKPRLNGLKLYFVMELLVGLFGVSMPWIVDGLGFVYMAMDSYAFAAMLSVILAGIGLGSLLHTICSRRIRNDESLLIFLEFAIGVAVLLSIGVIQHSVALRDALESQ